MSCAFEESGRIVVQCKMRNCKIYADPNTMMRVLHVFLHGLPTYDLSDELRPLELDADSEASPGLQFEFSVSDSCLGLLDLDADPRRFDKQLPVLICNPRQVLVSFRSRCVKDIKKALYKILK